MGKPARSAFDNNPLRKRLAALRRRLRYVVTVRGVGWMLALVLLSTAIVGLADWTWHLPALFRALVLVALLSTSGILAFIHLLKPLLTRMDDLTLALRVEERYPSLNDALASTIQFLEQAERKAVQGETAPAAKESLALKREAARRAMQKAEGCDFNRIVDTRGMRTAGIAGSVAAASAAVLFLVFPGIASTAIARLADPFGSHAWPSATNIELDPYKSRIGRQEAFEVKGTLSGVIPDKAFVVYRVDDSSAVEHECKVVKSGAGAGSFVAQFRPGQLARNFRFQVRANDAVTAWFRVEVAPAPTLDYFNGKQSPQVLLRYPDYTELTPKELPPGTGSIDAIAGTVATLHAAANVPLRAAWIEYQPEPTTLKPISCLLPLGADGLPTLLTSAATSLEIAGRHQATLSEDRKSFTIRFMPRLSGSYALHFEDDTGLGSHRIYELHVRPDPAPQVTLERPNHLRESLDVLPTAKLPLRVLVEDPTFGIRSVWLDYRCHADEPFRQMLLADPRLAYSPAIRALTGSALAVAMGKTRPQKLLLDGTLSLPSIRHLDGSSLKEGDEVTIRAAADDHDNITVDKQPGVSSEVVIHIVSRAALDLALNNQQAKIQQDMQEIRQLERETSKKVNEIENRVGQTKKLSLEDQSELARLEQQQQQIRERLEAEGQDSLKGRVERVMETIKENDIQGSGTEERLKAVERDLDRLSREQLQQIEAALTGTRKLADNPDEQKNAAAKALEQEAEKAEKQARQLEKLANDKSRPEQERLRLLEEKKQLSKQAARLRELADETRKDAQKPAQEAEAQAKERAKELERLAQEREQLGKELQKQTQTETAGQERELLQLSKDQEESARAMREQAQAQADPKKGEQRDLKVGLTEARRRQEEVEKTLSEMLKRMEPWSSTREVKGEAQKILEEQRRLEDELEAMQKDGMLGKKLEELKPEQKAQLENATAAQQKLSERMKQLTEKMRRLSEERANTDTATAQEMRDAARQAEDSEIPAKMDAAKQQIEQNNLENAAREQKRAVAELQKLVKKMEDRRSAELERNIKEMKKAEERLLELADEQDLLQKKIKEADKIKDPKEREEELKRLARKQKELEEKTREAAKALSRMRNERAAQSLEQAAKQMEESVKRLERGEAPNEQQDEALERLDEAREDVGKARNQSEEELAREQLARVADVLKRLKERQDRQVAETARIHKEVLEQKGWKRTLLGSLTEDAEAQKGLADEAQGLAERDLASAEVFARQLRRAAEAMKQSSESFIRHAEAMKEKLGDTTPATEGERFQKQAQRRLQALVDALKMDDGDQVRPAGGANRGDAGGGQSRAPGDGIPPLAQLKLLRAMQVEVNDQTKDFNKEHPDPARLTDAQKKEIEGLRREQKAVADLIEEYSQRDEKEEGPKK
jgi:hypothetical protein